MCKQITDWYSPSIVHHSPSDISNLRSRIESLTDEKFARPDCKYRATVSPPPQSHPPSDRSDPTGGPRNVRCGRRQARRSCTRSASSFRQTRLPRLSAPALLPPSRHLQEDQLADVHSRQDTAGRVASLPCPGSLPRVENHPARPACNSS